MRCPGIASKTCCQAYRWNDLKGAFSSSFAGLPSGASGVGWQSSGSTVCKVQKNHRDSDGCLAANPDVWGSFAGMSWKKAGSKRSVEGTEVEDATCDSVTMADRLTLEDGTAFDIGEMKDEDVKELWALASNGTELGSLPKKFVPSDK